MLKFMERMLLVWLKKSSSRREVTFQHDTEPNEALRIGLAGALPSRGRLQRSRLHRQSARTEPGEA